MTRAGADFDPYRKWLGIPKERQPPNFYELLAITLDEDDPDVFRAAIEQRRRFIESKRGEGREEAVSEILYQIGEAEITLLDPTMRRDYDRTVGLFEKRKRRRQVDPNAPRSRFKSRPGKTVGEDPGTVRLFAGIMAVFVVGCGLITLMSGLLPWGKSAEKANAGTTPAAASDIRPAVAEIAPGSSAQIAEAASEAKESLPAPVLYLPGDLSIPNVPPNPAFTKKGGRYADGKVGRAIAFDGNTHTEVRGSLPTGNAPRTLAAWLRNERGPVKDNVHVITQGQVEKDRVFGIMEAGGNWRFFDLNGGLDSGIAVDREWHHHAVTFDGRMVRYFFDGKQVASTDRKLETGTDVLKIGGLGSQNNNFVGVIDEMYFFDVPLTDHQIRQLVIGTGENTSDRDAVVQREALPESDSSGSNEIAGNEWQSLFNGTDLTGWRFVTPQTIRGKANVSDCWTVDPNRQVLVAHGSKTFWSHWLETEEPYGDFVLELDWRFPPTGTIDSNGSGIVVRSSGFDNHGRNPRGIEIDFRPAHGEEGRMATGGLIAYEAPATNRSGKATPQVRCLMRDKPPGPTPNGGWNTCEITCRGDRLTVVMNGERVNEGWGIERTAGAICLRSQESDVEFRNIRIRRLDEEEQAKESSADI